MNSRATDYRSPYWQQYGWHYLFWAIYTVFWHFVSSPQPFSSASFLTSAVFALSNMGAVYLNVLILIPHLLNRKIYALYILFVLLDIALFSLVLGLGLYFTFNWIDPKIAEAFFSLPTVVLGSTLGSNMTAVIAFTAIYLLRQRQDVEKRNRDLKREKMAVELEYLKNQLNPHFLFNALNNIYVLIRKDTDAAADALAGFSDLLRYQLYAADAPLISLAEELQHLEQYAQLAKLRKSNDLQLDICFPEETGNVQIPPLLLLPLVENSFKHVDRKAGWINIKCQLEEERLCFSTSNNYDGGLRQYGKQATQAGGIGLSNLRKRLDLLYPNRHNIVIDRDPETSIFSVDLTIELHEMPNR